MMEGFVTPAREAVLPLTIQDQNGKQLPGKLRDVHVLALEEGALIGMSLLYGTEVRLCIVEHGKVTVEPLSTDFSG